MELVQVTLKDGSTLRLYDYAVQDEHEGLDDMDQLAIMSFFAANNPKKVSYLELSEKPSWRPHMHSRKFGVASSEDVKVWMKEKYDKDLNLKDGELVWVYSYNP